MNEFYNRLNELKIPFMVKRGKYKRLSMTYDRKGNLVIKVPYQANVQTVEKFILDNLDWVKKQYEKAKVVKRLYIDNENYLFLGKTYLTKYFESRHEEVILNNQELIVYAKDESPASRKKVIDKWLYKQAELVFNEMLSAAFNRMRDYLPKYPTLKIKHYSSRWGCCYPKRAEIVINIDTIHLPFDLINYVIYHELCHFVYLNHGSLFHQFLSKWVPNEKKLHREFKKYHTNYE